MNNTEKLLRAFIEASGFDIEELVDTKQTPISKQSGLHRITSSAITMKNSNLVVESDGAYKRGDDECYYLKASFDVDYKVTKKVDTASSLNQTLDEFIELTPGADLTRARLTFWKDGVPTCSYSDYKERMPNTNPVVADYNGVFPDIWITPPYSVVLSNSRGVDLFTKVYL